MHTGHEITRSAVSRRVFLAASGLTFGGLNLPASAAPETRRHAKSTILIWLSGGASHIDTWDLKPDAPAEFRGEFKPIKPRPRPGVRMCEHLPLLARQCHHLAVVNSLGHYTRGTGDHHAGSYYNLTGRAPDPSFRQLLNDRKPLPTDWPFVGSVVASKRPPHPYLPSLITLPQKPGAPRYTRPGQFSAKLGNEFEPVYLLGSLDRPSEFAAPVLTLEGDVSPQRLADRRTLLNALDGVARNADAAEGTYSKQQQKGIFIARRPADTRCVRRRPRADDCPRAAMA